MPALQLHRPTGPSTAWKGEDLLRLLATTGIGLALMVAAWWQAADEVLLEDQVGWANLSVGGALLASYGLVSWILRGRRAVGQRRVQLLGEAVVVDEPGPTTSGDDTIVQHDGALVAVVDRRFFHRAGCPLTIDRPTEATSRDAHLAAGRDACGVCRP